MLMDPRRWREGGRSLGEGKIDARTRGVFDVTFKRREGSSDLESLKLEGEEEEQMSLDNLFFTFCCGDNLTCLKSNMVCDGSFDCPDGEDEVHCEMEPKAEEEQLNKKKENFSNDLVSIQTKVKRRRRLRKVVKESESDDKEEEELGAQAEKERRNGVATKVRRRKKVRKETGANKPMIEEENDIESMESNLTAPKGDEIDDVATETTEI